MAFKPRHFVCNLGATARCRHGFISLKGLRHHHNSIHPVLTHDDISPVHDDILPAHPPVLPLEDHPLSPPPEGLLCTPSPDCLTNPPSPRSPYQAYVEDAPDEDDLELALPQARRIQHPILDVKPHLTVLAPFENRAQFEIADFLFHHNQMPASHIDILLELWAASQHEGNDPLFTSHTDLYNKIDSIGHGDVPWESFSIQYCGDLPAGKTPAWMQSKYKVWFCNPRALIQNQIGNPDYSDFMMANWAWRQANKIAEDPATHGGMFIPIILSSDKTTVSVATGQNEYYPLYISNGNIHNNVRHAHQNGVSLAGFLSIPKTDRAFVDNATFCSFRRQLYHLSLAQILEPLRSGMTTPEITRCPDDHLRRVIYGIGPYIADYPKQVMLACIVSGWCPRCTAHCDNFDGGGGGGKHSHGLTELLMEAYDDKELWDNHGVIPDILPFTASFPRADIHELISFDILHQMVHTAGIVTTIMADIDRRIAAVPSFLGLRQFLDGRGFKQWTGDDSKALMKVFLPAIVGHVPPQMVRAIAAFTDFCYLVRQSIINEDTLAEIDEALHRFHADRVIFKEIGVCPTSFSLFRQHSLIHYWYLIQDFGAPNGLYSSIMESKHIKAVKEPWRWSNRFNALGQMLLTNQCLDKLAASRVDFEARRMLKGPCISESVQALTITAGDVVPDNNGNSGAVPDHNGDGNAVPDHNDNGDAMGAHSMPAAARNNARNANAVDGPRVQATVTLARKKARGYPRWVDILAERIGILDLLLLVQQFLYDQLNPDAMLAGSDVDITECPRFNTNSKISVFHSA
ncbi:hypothetical protein EW146_g9212 [Bondarzewia mesenterica]|uniref:C2H2-type domain-containing protein n=1 Tax=Bondarzewia mesenterica TaxID=1095465 RepID=A0A4S4LA34_9AGAM|nr:hypothetical protein EW146_g9212 [Bondarzewia mesenterica]